ncbi:MAG: murein hydrolase activator EnvC family protein [Patescibacteria group bacterium]
MNFDFKKTTYISFGLFLTFFLSVLFFGYHLFYFVNEAKGESGTSADGEVKMLERKIGDKRDKIEDIKEKQEEYSNLISEAQQKQKTLENQLDILDNQIAKAELEVERVEGDISRVNLDIARVKVEIENKNKQIDEQKEHIADILQLLYKEGEADALKIVLLNNTLSEFLDRLKYLEDVNEEMNNSVEELKEYKKELEENRGKLEVKKSDLEELKKELKDKKLALEDKKDQKQYILQETKNSEERYNGLLKKAEQAQKQAQQEIVTLEKEVRQKMEELSKDKLELNPNGLIWPLSGEHTITATFHDPDYPFRYLFEHPAIDIRASHGTPIKAAASGYVARVKLDQTASYGYIMIVHGEGMSTVYGHINESYVSEDDYVTQGQNIGLSGGLPGTRGAGYLTTGPHLHFEIRKNGIPVNPLDYLPNNYSIL